MAQPSECAPTPALDRADGPRSRPRPDPLRGLLAALRQTALGICHGFDDGLTFVQVGGPLIDGGATPHQAAVEIIGAVDAYCPRNDRALSFANPPIQLVDNNTRAHVQWLPV